MAAATRAIRGSPSRNFFMTLTLAPRGGIRRHYGRRRGCWPGATDMVPKPADPDRLHCAGEFHTPTRRGAGRIDCIALASFTHPRAELRAGSIALRWRVSHTHHPP